MPPATADTLPSCPEPVNGTYKSCSNGCEIPPPPSYRKDEPASKLQFSVVSNDVIHSRYMTVYNRKIQFPATEHNTAQVHEFDIVGHPKNCFDCAVVFPFHPYTDGRKGGEVTLVIEYAQALDCMMWALPTGGYDQRKHKTVKDTGIAELSEEAHLQGGQWVRLVPEGHPGFPEIKWCSNRYTPFLVIDPKPDEQPGHRDAEELIQIVRVDIARLKEIMMSGYMQPQSVTASFMSMERLKEMGHL